MLQNRLAKLREARANGEGGFTLIELLVVVVIIGVLIAIAIPLYLNYTKSSNDTAAQSDLRASISVLETCNSSIGTYPVATFTAGSTTTSSSYAPCTNQTINTSKGTQIKYYPDSSSGTNYMIEAYSNSGNKTVYCYTSAAGGSVKKTANTAATFDTAYAATCPA